MENGFSADRVYLIGYMGSGKSTVGKLLAEQLGWNFLDTDEAISELQGKSISTIFEEDGEERFRALEKAFLSFTTELRRQVIATGGGMPTTPENLSTILNSGITIFLDCDSDTLGKRISESIDRPLHQQPTNQLQASIESNLKSRMSFYIEAHITVENSSSPDLTVQRIIDKL